MLIPHLYHTKDGCVNGEILNNSDLLLFFYSIEIIMVSYVWNIDPVKKLYYFSFFEWSRVFHASPNKII